MTGFVCNSTRQPCYRVAAHSLPVSLKKEVVMEVKVCVRNLSTSTTQKELNALFERAGVDSTGRNDAVVGATQL